MKGTKERKHCRWFSKFVRFQGCIWGIEHSNDRQRRSPIPIGRVGPFSNFKNQKANNNNND